MEPDADPTLIGAAELAEHGHRRRLVRTSGIAASANVVLLVVAVADSVITARLLGARGKGSLFLVTTVVSLVVLLFTCSVGPALQVATTKGRLGVGTAARFCAVWAGSLGVVVLLAAVLLGGLEVFAGFATVGALLVPAEALMVMLTPVFVAADRVGRRSIIDVFGAVLDLVLTAGFILSGGDRVFRGLVGIVVGRWIVSLMLLGDLWRHEGMAIGRGWQRSVVAAGLRQHPGSLFARAAKRADSFLLAGFLGTRAVGIYSVAATLAEIPLYVVRAVQPSIISFTASLGVRSAKDAARVSRAVLWGYVILLVPYGLVSSLLMVPVFGRGFGDAVAPLLVLLVSTLCVAYYFVPAGYFVGIGRPGIVSLIMVVPLVANTLLSVVLIPTHGLVGNALASAIGGFLTAGIAIVVFSRSTGQPPSASLVPRWQDLQALRPLFSREHLQFRSRAEVDVPHTTPWSGG